MIKKSFKGNLKNSTKKDLLSTINDLDDIIDVNRFFKNKNINKDLAKKLLGESKFSDDLEKPLSNASKAASETAKDLEKVGEASKSVSNVASDLEKVGSVAEASADGVTVLKAATEGLESGEASAEGLGTAFKGLGISILSALPAITAIGIGIAGLVAAYKYVTKFDTAVEKASTSQVNFEQTKSELSSLQDELDSTKDKIKEINQKGSLTFADKAQLSSLKEQSKELQRQIDLKKKLTDTQSKKATNDAMDALGVKTFIDHTSGQEIASSGHGDVQTNIKRIQYKQTDIVTAAKNEVKELNKLKEKREKLLNDYDSAKTDKKKSSINDKIKSADKDIEKYEDTVSKKIKKLTELQKNFMDGDNNLKDNLTSKQKQMYDSVTKVLDDYINNDPVAKKAAALEKIWDNKDFAKAQQSLVDKIRQGQDVSVDSLKKDFPELVSACDKAGISVSDLKNELDALGQSSSGVTKLENDFEEFQTTAVGAINSVDALNAALANNVSGKGLGIELDDEGNITGDLVDIKSAFSSLDGYDPSVLFEKTANGVHLNAKALRELQAQQEALQKNKFLEQEKTLQEQLNTAIMEQKKYAEGSDDYMVATAQVNSLKEQLETVKELSSAYDGATSAYQKWVNAQSNGEEGDMFRTVSDTMKSRGEELYKEGRYNTNEFRAIAQYYSDEDLSTAPIDKLVDAYQRGKTAMDQFFTGDKSGIDNFVSQMKQISDSENLGWVEDLGNGKLKFNIDDEDIAKRFHISTEAVQALIRAMQEYDDVEVGSKDGTQDFNQSIEEMTKKADEAKQHLQEMQNSNLDLNFDFNTTDIDNLNSQIERAKGNLDQFKGEDGTVDIHAEGAQDAITILQTLIQQKQLASQPVIMDVDVSKLDSGVADTVTKLQEYQTALNEVNAMQEMQDAGVAIDTSKLDEAKQKVDDLFGELQGKSKDGSLEIVPDVKIDTSTKESLESALKGMTPEIKAKIVPDESSSKSSDKKSSKPSLDTSSTKVQSSQEVKIKYTGKQPKVKSPQNVTIKYGGKKPKVKSPQNVTVKYNGKKPKVKSPQTVKVNYTGKKPKVKSPQTVRVNWSVPKLPTPGSVTVKVKYDTSGKPKFNGTAHYQGSAHVMGSSYASGNWGVKKNETALVGELGTEVLVRHGKYTTLGDNGAEFVNLRAGDIIFNHKQSEELFKYGHVTSGGGRARVVGQNYANGTAYSAGTWTMGNVGNGNVKGSGSSTKKATPTKSSGTSKARSSSGSNTKSNSNSKSSESAEKSEELLDWIETLLSRASRLTELATSAVDRAVGFANKQNALVDAVTKTQNEITTNQNAANKYFAQANSLGLAPGYVDKIKNGTLDIESITDDNLKDKISKYKDYYEKGLSAQDKVLDLQDKLNELYQKRLEIIEKEYDTIVEVNNSLKDMLDAKISYNSAYGVANDNQDNIDSINKSIKAQEDTFNQLTKKFDEYQKEVNSQIISGVLKQGSEDYKSAQKNLNDFTANIYKASQELIELQDKLVKLRVDAIQTIIDTFKRRSDKLDKYSSLLEAKDETVPESVYQERLDNNNDTIRKNQEARAIWLQRQATEDVNSDNYKKYAEEIQKLDESTLDLMKDNEDLKNSIYSLRIKNLEDAIKGYDDLETELKGFRDLLNDDAFLDKKGGITDEGLAQITLLSQSIGNAKQKISDLTTGLQKVKKLYDNGVISLKEYNEKSAEYRKELQSSTSDVKSYQKSLTDLYQNALKTEVDALQKVINKRKEATQAKEEYYSYDKKIREQTNDVNALKSQVAALEGVNDAATLAKKKKLEQQLKDAQETLDDTKRDHRNDLISKGYDKISDDLNQMLEDTEYEISHNADKQNEIIQSMLNKQVGMYQEAYSKINSIIKDTGWVGSNDFNNNQSQMSSQTGAQNQASNASQSQQTANSKPSSSASGTDTSGIKDNASENNKITENIMKPENTTNRPVAELKVSTSSVSIEEGKSTSVTAKVRPNDAANKTLSWKSSNTAIATVSNGTISGKKPGSCQVTVSTTDGSGISKTIAVTVTKKPDPPKPAIPSNKGGDGVPRVGDVVTFNGKYYYDSWGKRPAGSLYSGVKNGVVIDSYSSRDYGGSARYTGDLKVHIKSADGRYGDLGWVRLSQISGYAKGTPGVDRDQIAIVDEKGRELQIPNGKGGRITKLEKGTGVIPHTATEKLMALSEQLDNNGNMVINGRTIEEYVNDMANMQSIAVPDFSDVTASVVSQLEGKGMGNVMVENHYDSLLTVEGNVDKDALPGLEDILKRSYEYTSKQMIKEARKVGTKIRR
nr:MAG TPA: ATPase [Caudoviricetes sp.]